MKKLSWPFLASLFLSLHTGAKVPDLWPRSEDALYQKERSQEFLKRQGRPYPFHHAEGARGMTYQSQLGPSFDHACMEMARKKLGTSPQFKRYEMVTERVERMVEGLAGSLMSCQGQYPELAPYMQAFAGHFQQVTVSCTSTDRRSDAYVLAYDKKTIYLKPDLWDAFLEERDNSSLILQSTLAHEIFHQVKGDNRCDHNKLSASAFDPGSAGFCSVQQLDDRIYVLQFLCMRDLSMRHSQVIEDVLARRMEKCGKVSCERVFNQAGVKKGFIGFWTNIFSSYSLTLDNPAAEQLCARIQKAGQCHQKRQQLLDESGTLTYLLSRPTAGQNKKALRDFWKLQLDAGQTVFPLPFLNALLGNENAAKLALNACYQSISTNAGPVDSLGELEQGQFPSTVYGERLKNLMAAISRAICPKGERVNAIIALTVFKDRLEEWARNTESYLVPLTKKFLFPAGEVGHVGLEEIQRDIAMLRGNLAPTLGQEEIDSLQRFIQKNHVESQDFECAE